MPAYPLAFPAVYIEEVRVRRVHSTVRFDNPLDLTVQVQRRGPMRFEIDVTLQPMSRIDAHTTKFAQFLEDLQGGWGTFQFALNPWCVGMDPLPGTRTFRLASNDPGWSAKASEMGFSFTAVEVL
jgi:hypothetical protein